MNEDRGARYHRLRRRAGAAAAALGAAWLILVLRSPIGGWLAHAAAAAGAHVAPSFTRTLSVTLFVVVVAVGYEAVTLPFALYRNFVLDRRYGLSSEALSRWALDHVKAVVLALILTIAAAIAVSSSIERTATWWWAISAGLFVAAGVLVAIAAPVALMPLFYRFNPLERDALRERLLTLTNRAGVRVLGAFEWGLGEKTTRANAALVGLGRTRRILVSDTLLRAYSDDEIEVILAHEIAHHVHRDIWRGLGFESGVVGIGLLAGHLAVRAWGPVLGGAHLGDLTALPLVALVLGGVSLAFTPLRNAWSRHSERRADRFALRLTGQPAAFISAMRRLGAQNLADERPSPVAFWFFHTHPTMDERIEAARRYG